MDPLTMVAVAVALGASEGGRETAKKVVVDSYTALRQFISNHYGSVTAEVEGVESEPEEQLRRQLLAKKLGQAGAGGDDELVALGQELLRLVDEYAPEAAEAVGVHLVRVAAAGDVEITDVDVEDGSGVRAEDVNAGGSVTVRGVTVRGAQEPPPSVPGSPVDGETATARNTFTSTQSAVTAGRDVITNFGANSSGSNAGRVRAVTSWVERNPLGENFWTVKVNNGTKGPITDLDVDIYIADDHGDRAADQCVPAKHRVSLPHLFEKLLGPALEGGLTAVGNRAQTMYSGFGGISPGGVAGLGAYGQQMASHLAHSPQASAILRQAQASMAESFPRVLTAETSAEVVFLAEGPGQVRVDITFNDEDGTRWVRPFDQTVRTAE